MKQLICIFIILPFTLIAQLRVSLESGLVFTQYNDVRVPNGGQNVGTLFSLNNDFSDENTTPFFRAEMAYTISDRHFVEATAAPLVIKYKNATLPLISFAGQEFAGEGINGQYEFNTYRFSYRYRLVDKPTFTFDLGASLLVRDARIALAQGSLVADDTDLGFVPLVSFELNKELTKEVSFMLKGDALVGPVGRAEDIFAGILYNLRSDKYKLKAGYRLIEGGADVDQVYNFAFIHFADIGLIGKF